MSARARLFAYGTAALVAVAGALSAVFAPGVAGIVLGAALGSIGLGAIVLLVFFEVGLSEDRARALEEQQRRAPPETPRPAHGDWPTSSRRRPGRRG
jgi:hypothetical protein